MNFVYGEVMVNSLCICFISICLLLCELCSPSLADDILELLTGRVQVEFQLATFVLSQVVGRLFRLKFANPFVHGLRALVGWRHVWVALERCCQVA